MPNEQDKKKNLRRFPDGLYTVSETSSLIRSILDPENELEVNEVLREEWEAAVWDIPEKSSREWEQDKAEARRLLGRMKSRHTLPLRRVSWWAAAVVAIVSIIGTITRWVPSFTEKDLIYTEVCTGVGEIRRVVLPDGSEVVLNACSSLSYPESFRAGSREVTLEGEAYFRVVSDPKKVFSVSVNQLHVEVLGTSFNVHSYQYDELAFVNVESGKVKVSLPDAMMCLVADEGLSINNLSGEYTKKREKVGVAVWMKGELHFYHTPLRDVAKQLERLYQCRIHIPPGDEYNYYISGQHDNESLEEILRAIEYVSGVKFRIEGQEVFLSR